MGVSHRLGVGLLRLGGAALSVLAYSYLELLDVRGQAQGSGGGGSRLSTLLASSLGEAAAHKWEGAAMPPILQRLWLNHLPFLLLALLAPALVLPGTTLLGVNAIYFYGCLVAAALRDPHSPNTPDSGSGGGWMGGMSLVLFVFSALIYWLEPGGGGVQSEDRVRFRPFEAEIRQLLLKHDPSQLHLVDGWLQQHRWNPRKLYKDLLARYESTAPAQAKQQQQPAAAAAAAAAARARPSSHRSTATTASAASSSSPGRASSYHQQQVAAGAGYGRGRQQHHQQRGVYGAHDYDREEYEEHYEAQEHDDQEAVYHDAAAGAGGYAYSRGEEKAAGYGYGGGGGYNERQGQGQQGVGGRGGAVSAVMAATRDYQEGILARQQERLRSLHVSSPPRRGSRGHSPTSFSQPAGSPGRPAAGYYPPLAHRHAYSQR